MVDLIPFSKRIIACRYHSSSNLILAIDPIYGTDNLFTHIINLICKLSPYLCAIKLNLPVLLSMSFNELQKISEFAHEKNLQVIADIKLNDIPNTNNLTIQYLYNMGFDCIIVNPFIGKLNLKSTVEYAHSLNCGILSLVFMSHEGANEGFGATIIDTHNDISNTISSFYHLFYKNSKHSGVDGIVIGGNKLDIIKELSSKNNDKIPIYSPGLITQGGSIKSAMESGSDYLIIGRAIINSSNPLIELKNIHQMINRYLK
ncbi:MAG: orotidine 5'-phosphate decarboxylase / HUMPS family protein [Candidatus Nitrosocosmicus sp.]